MLTRRDLIRVAGSAALISGSGAASAQMPNQPGPQPDANQSGSAPSEPADHTIRIATGLLELGPETTVSTKLYNGRFPGPLLRLQQGRPVVVDIFNDTDTPEQLHWHGLFLPADVDGAAEEGTPFIPPHGHRRVSFRPEPAGFRFFHSHAPAGIDLSAGTYSGQVGLVYVEPRQEPGDYDREVFLTLKEFSPFLSRTEMALDFLAPTQRVAGLREAAEAEEVAAAQQGRKQGYELGYNFAAINGWMLGSGEPIRVKAGERVLFHIVNASASEIRGLALPGHVFRVVALDGNPVPKPAEVPVLWIGTAERISAIVDMKQPGVWVLGEINNEDRGRGMGIVIEYAGSAGPPQWKAPKPFRWDYRRFAKDERGTLPPDETIEMTFRSRVGARDGFDEFSINGVPFSMEKMEPLFQLTQGRRYRLRMLNGTDDTHPVHLHRHSFELSSIAGQPTSGVIKDVAMIGPFQEMTVDFTADQPGLSLFHCHMQNHMDFGFMALFACS